MVDENKTEGPRGWHRIRKAALAVLFSAILVIPAIRRLRRRIWEWSAVRILVALAGCLLGWRYKHANGGLVDLVVGVGLMAFGLLVRAKPQAKPADALACELDALVVLNGGAVIPPGAERPLCLASIFVNPDRLFVIDEQGRRVLEIPVVRIRELTVRALPDGNHSGGEPQGWELAIQWESKDMRMARFQYEGAFAEHLARVAESTVQNLTKPMPPISADERG